MRYYPALGLFQISCRQTKNEEQIWQQKDFIIDLDVKMKEEQTTQRYKKKTFRGKILAKTKSLASRQNKLLTFNGTKNWRINFV